LLENVSIEQSRTGEMRHMRAKIQWRDKVHFTAVADSGHQIPLDGPAEAGGENRGSRPMELVLMGLGGCTSYDVVNILTKSRQDVVDCVTELSADRAEDVPQVFERIHIHFIISGRNLDDKKVARAVSLSADKYCSASIMLERAGVHITHDYEIINIA
jgi:putative redox protein